MFWRVTGRILSRVVVFGFTGLAVMMSVGVLVGLAIGGVTGALMGALGSPGIVDGSIYLE